jgi:hypothetical protein
MLTLVPDREPPSPRCAGIPVVGSSPPSLPLPLPCQCRRRRRRRRSHVVVVVITATVVVVGTAKQRCHPVANPNLTSSPETCLPA